MWSILLTFCTTFCNRIAPGCVDALVEALSSVQSSASGSGTSPESSGNLGSSPSDNPMLEDKTTQKEHNDRLLPKHPSGLGTGKENGPPKIPSSDVTGEDTHLIPARRLQITHSENPDQCKWTYLNNEPRFSGVEVAELLSVPSLNIEAKINYTNWPLVSGTEYHFYLIFKTTKGWKDLDSLMEATVKKNQPQSMYGFLVDSAIGSRSLKTLLPWQRPDGWMELRLGKFFCEDNNKDQEVAVTLKGVQRGRFGFEKDYKGLIIAGIEFRPVDKLKKPFR